MAEYIDREAAINEQKRFCGYLDNDMLNRLEIATRKIPAADVRPVVTARWISVPHKKARICSRCYCDEPYKFADADADVYDFCPHCGADMRKGRDNG